MSTIKSQPKQTTTANLDDFVVLGKLGEGSFSTVHKVRRITDGKIYALKKVHLFWTLDQHEEAEVEGKIISH